jgi:hypothetical protein
MWAPRHASVSLGGRDADRMSRCSSTRWQGNRRPREFNGEDQTKPDQRDSAFAPIIKFSEITHWLGGATSRAAALTGLAESGSTGPL